MTDYINRKALNEKCYAIYEETMRQGKDLTIEEVDRLLQRFEEEIKKAPAEDVAPVVRGRWIWADLHNDGTLTLCCSQCLATEGARETAGYCSECGSRMDGDGK